MLFWQIIIICVILFSSVYETVGDDETTKATTPVNRNQDFHRPIFGSYSYNPIKNVFERDDREVAVEEQSNTPNPNAMAHNPNLLFTHETSTVDDKTMIFRATRTEEQSSDQIIKNQTLSSNATNQSMNSSNELVILKQEQGPPQADLNRLRRSQNNLNVKGPLQLLLKASVKPSIAGDVSICVEGSEDPSSCYKFNVDGNSVKPFPDTSSKTRRKLYKSRKSYDEWI